MGEMTSTSEVVTWSWLLPKQLRMSNIRRSGRDWLVDCAVCLMALAYVALSLNDASLPTSDRAGLYRGDAEWMLLLDVLLGIGSGVLLWLRRRAPVWVTVLLSAAVILSPAAEVAGLLAVISVGIYCRPGTATALAVTFGTADVVGYVVRPASDLTLPAASVVSLAFAGLALAWGLYIRARRQLLRELRDRAVRAEQDNRRRERQARQLERARIAREMHDVLAHRLSLLSLHAGALAFRPDATATEVAATATVIRQSAHQALEDLRTVIGVLRSEPDSAMPEQPQPRLSDLPALVSEAREAGAQVGFTCTIADLEAVPETVGRAAYRIVQEGLTNARKHAPDAPVTVLIGGEPADRLTVTITNGAAASSCAIPGAGTGLIGVAERVTLLGGELRHGRRPDGGFQLVAVLPSSDSPTPPLP